MPKKTAVITGVGRGIGQAIAKKFLAEGWHVIGTYHHSKPTAQENFDVVQMDITKSESVLEAVQQIQRKTKHVDVLVNNSGVFLDLEEKIDLPKIKATFDINLFGLIDVTQNILPMMSEGGQIISISSRYGSFSEMPIEEADAIGYRLSKAGVNMMTRILAFMLREKKITVSAIHPGWVNTDMGRTARDPGDIPDREPSEAAEDVYKLATSNVPSGKFWFKGKEFGW
jgi:NAD(P)-dependent dehydrogenase (short-subunit alcohol dehydrogenase family)